MPQERRRDAVVARGRGRRHGADATRRNGLPAHQHRACEDADVARDPAVDERDAAMTEPKRRVALGLGDKHRWRRFVERAREQITDGAQFVATDATYRRFHRAIVPASWRRRKSPLTGGGRRIVAASSPVSTSRLRLMRAVARCRCDSYNVL